MLTVEKRAIQIIRLGPPYDQEPNEPASIKNYNESRSLGLIEEELLKVGMWFSFSEHFHHLISQFPEVDTLNILDSGCGNGIASKGMKKLARKLGKDARVTAVILATRNIRIAVAMGVDELIVGRFQQYPARIGVTPKYHFALDFFGPAYHSWEADQPVEGSTVIPIYGSLLVPGGTALLAMQGFSARDQVQSRERIVDLMHQNGLAVLQVRDKYALVEKQAT